MNKTVMIIDDSQFMRNLIKGRIVENGYDVIAEAGSGEEAIELYKIHLSAIVLSDITLPGLDGIATLKEIKKINPNVHVIMCSSLGTQDLIIAALQNGASDFIVKPFFDNLIPALNKLTMK
ncbi:response regulator [Sporosarcina beigongshangi]|uniref:response regulator n=1 Tax=Sporosarcina beigongshangi TaxID=2782538 RepID=UPI001939ACFD|nr:response regulator [Sporosarcina beigongshangi]